MKAKKPVTFISQTASNTDTPRIPQDLTNFIAEGTITQAILTDPNTVLRNAIAGQTITKTIIFTVSTNPATPELGGGTANIAFLLGDPVTTAQPQGPNASAVQMTATFWIETVQHRIVVPPFVPGQVSHLYLPFQVLCFMIMLSCYGGLISLKDLLHHLNEAY